ncbi:ATP-binding protein [Streptomyces sp. NBC_01341]|uniref:ATP-binding protein n=1 Tax=Streptomyces sp. NBC_01341 TaxID=2903831 RepID=UPI002E13F291|nr:ATP-binding protein [Streptomyces sp. NBC_01341]
MNGQKINDASAPFAPTRVRGDGSDSIHQAREASRTFADSLTPAPDPATADSLVLVVSELTTNAVRHGGGRYTLELSATPDCLTAEVSDPSPSPPRERAPDLNGGSGGFGWHMVRRLASELTVIYGPTTGKTIRARLAY